LNLEEVVQVIKAGLTNPVDTWPGYSPAGVPLVVFDDEAALYLNHPSPPVERPPELMAATAQQVGGVLTATLPLWMCQDPRSLMPLVYHECFHVYQEQGGFLRVEPDEDFSFQRALSFFPELDPLHRAFCRAECEVLNDLQRIPEEQAILLAGLSTKRFALLEDRPEALALTRQTERREGPAYYIQQQVDCLLNGSPIPKQEVQFGYSRQYHVGAAICRLLSQLVEDWCQSIEAGLSPSEVLVKKFGGNSTRLTDLDLDQKTRQETFNVRSILAEVQASLPEPAVRLRVSSRGEAARVWMRGFNPMTVRSLGDGRLFHSGIYILQGPAGILKLKSGTLLENFTTDEIIFVAKSLELNGHRLDLETEEIAIHLEGVVEIDKGMFGFTNSSEQ
jgi:hypothetical protein